MEGVLEKKKQDGKGFLARAMGEWQKRFFALRNCTLRYYERPRDCHDGRPAKGVLNLRELARAERTGEDERCLALATATRTFQLRAATVEEGRLWLEVLAVYGGVGAATPLLPRCVAAVRARGVCWRRCAPRAGRAAQWARADGICTLAVAQALSLLLLVVCAQLWGTLRIHAHRPVPRASTS